MPLPGPEDPPATNWSAVLGVLFCVTTTALVLADQFGTLARRGRSVRGGLVSPRAGRHPPRLTRRPAHEGRRAMKTHSRPGRSGASLISSSTKPVDLQRVLDLIPLTEAQRRVRDQHRPIGFERVRPPKRDQLTAHIRSLHPALDAADPRDVSASVRRLAGPVQPGTLRGNSHFEHQSPVAPQGSVNARECLHPVVVGAEHLRDVARHRRHVDLERRKLGRVAVQPADPVGEGLLPRHS